MTWLGLPLTALAGAALGVFGAGGSILLVPLLVYALGVAPKSAVAISLLAVGATSTAALLTGRAAQVRWRVGVPFSAAAMGGAYAGGRIAVHLPETLLLVGFALLMLGTAVAMLRRRRLDPEAGGVGAGALRSGAAVVLGAPVGFVAGLVGAGGGFLIVPALVLLGGLPFRAAIATSLLVLAVQSFAGLAGHASHVDLDWAFAAAVTACSVAGSALGSRLSARLPAGRLRLGFAWLVAAVGVAVLAAQIPGSWLAPAARWGSALAPLLGGALIGLAAAVLWLLNGRIAGVSGIAGGLLQSLRGDHLWRVLFLVGLGLGGVLAHSVAPAAFEAVTTAPATVLIAGLLVGAGTTLANGCTSGHGVCGVSRLSPRSLAAVGTFMATGMVTVYLVRHAWGGWP